MTTLVGHPAALLARFSAALAAWSWALAVLALAELPDARAGQFDLFGARYSAAFGTSVTVLPNGNFVVTDPAYGPGGGVGAVYLYDGVSLALISVLTGSWVNDKVGSGGVTVLNNGNYIVSSPNWGGRRGAATWCNGTTGVTGAVSTANSLVGGFRLDDQVGSGGVIALNNGNYVVSSPFWDNLVVFAAGAATWGNGTTGVTGVVSPGNSLVGSGDDQVGSGGVIALNNGNYVVSSPNWNGARGAVTWCNGTTGVWGQVRYDNSLVGTTADDQVGFGGVTALNNGNYVVSSPNWNAHQGAATWGNGTTGVTGAVSPTNSLVGITAGDYVGDGGVIALNNGNYVVSSPIWNSGVVAAAGAATWGNGTTGVTGAVSPSNSLVGITAGDYVGDGVTALNNGNYVVSSPFWNNGVVVAAGAATWGNGTTGVTGAVSPTNSLVGSGDDYVGYGGVIALNNGNYVVSSPNWNAHQGAATWGNGITRVAGVVSVANSLVGTGAFDYVGYGVTSLNNGNYVVSSPDWNNSTVAGAGAATWGNGTTGVTGAVSPANSLVGTTASDYVGDGITALSNGNYVVSSHYWNNGTVAGAGAISLGDGTLGTTGLISQANSVLGTLAGGGSDMVFAYDLLHARLLVGYPFDSRVSIFGYTPAGIAVQQPVNVNLANGGTRVFGAPLGTNASLTFTIKNTNLGDLTGLGITIDGSDAKVFTVTAGPTAPLRGPFGSTTFTVRFTPTTAGVKTAALHIASNDPQQNPFNINLSGRVLSFSEDADGDGLSDAAEFYLSALGLDWQVSQSGLVNALFANANGAGLYTTSQVQALNVGTPLLAKDPASGLFTVTIGVQKATNLINFSPFPMTAPQTIINAQGKLEFQFIAPDNAAFFRLESH